MLIQGRGVDAAELVASCIEWPEPTNLLACCHANFPAGSRTPALLKQLLLDGEVDAPDFLQWATSRREVPFGGLAATESQKIKLRFDDSTTVGEDERLWPLPQAQTCMHTVKLTNFANRAVLRDKLRMAIAHREEGFQRDD